MLDDGSNSGYVHRYDLINQLPFVRIEKNEKNRGRMETRLRLSSFARFNYLLFLDADSEIEYPGFLMRYFDEIDNDAQLVSGGRVYPPTAPSCEYRLHWRYGRCREDRKKNPNAGFMSNNFLVKKELFNKINHPFELKGYGHEDSWWGMQFEKFGVQWSLIDNPVLHGSLESSDVFLKKSENALANILLLEKTTDHQLLRKHIRIYRWYRRLKSMGLSGVFLFFENLAHKSFRKNILSCQPSLFKFDCYRLAHLIRIGKLRN